MQSLDNFYTLGKALVTLFKPLVEVVIHNPVTKKIIFIEGGISKRAVGDPSLFESEVGLFEPEVYSKVNFDGRLLRSISIPLQEDNQLIALMCINYDTSVFQEITLLSKQLLGEPLITRKPEILFKNDWQNKVNEFIATHLTTHNKRFETLTTKDKKEIITLLFDSGAFKEKKAVDYIASLMDMGRATIFNYLKKLKYPLSFHNQ